MERQLSPGREAQLRRIFQIALVLKAAHSVFEIVGGVMLFLTSPEAILALATMLTNAELIEDPDDRIANTILGAAEKLSAADLRSATFFLLSHGAVKLFLVSAVMLEYAWAYPAFMIALAGLILYQTYQLAHGLSLALLALTIIDLIVLWLTWHEYRLIRRGRASPAAGSD
jgi:uncharacterized membrane protein